MPGPYPDPAFDAEIRRRFLAGRDNRTKGLEATRGHAYLIDQLVRVLHDHAFERAYPNPNPAKNERHAIVAVGGYGRGELAPHSDVDLLFLLSYKLTPHAEQVIEYMLYMLWDLGLKVGHATRSVDECLRMAKADLTVRTALLEARYLWGENALYQELRRRFRDLAGSDALGFVEAKLAERDERHKKLGDSRYVLEPNIKDGKGGLRDLHTLYWIAKYIYRVDEPADLVARGVFTGREAARFQRAHAFLTTVRCHLHYLAGRAEERLTFDLQPAVAARMGLPNSPSLGMSMPVSFCARTTSPMAERKRVCSAASSFGSRASAFSNAARSLQTPAWRVRRSSSTAPSFSRPTVSSIIGSSRSMWSREASSGTTPPCGRCSSTWLQTRFASRPRSPS